MQTSELRPCDACTATMIGVVYEISVKQHVEDSNGVLQPVGKPLDLQLCIRCACGLNTHALPLAIQHREQTLDRARRGSPVIPQPPAETRG